MPAPKVAGVHLQTACNNRPGRALQTMTAGINPMSAQVASQAGSAGPSPGETDEALALRLRDGDTAAGEVLVKRFHQPLFRYLHRLAGTDHLAEELHQQTWLSVLDHIEKFDPASTTGGFKAWLFRIATNKANDYWRSRSREKSATEGLKLVTEEALPAAGERLENTEQQLKLQRAIQQLPEAQRQVLMLRYYSNLRFVEIADMLGCPLNTALGRMHKAVLKLRQLMEA